MYIQITEKVTIISRENITVQKIESTIKDIAQLQQFYKEYNQNKTFICNCILKTGRNYREVEIAMENESNKRGQQRGHQTSYHSKGIIIKFQLLLCPSVYILVEKY